MVLPLLNVISSFSLLRGVLSPDAVGACAHRYGYRIIAVTDRNNLYGFPEIVAAGHRFDLTIIPAAEMNDGADAALLYADGEDGFASLCSVISEFHTSLRFSLFDSVIRHHRGLHIVSDNRELVGKLTGNASVYFRLSQPRRLPEWVRKNGIPALVVPPVAFTADADFRTHRFLTAIGGNTTLSRLEPEQLLPENALFQDPTQLVERFEIFEEACTATVEFARKVKPYCGRDGYIMPAFHRSGGAAVEQLRKKTYTGATDRYGTLTETVKKRIEYELELIIGKGFADYFLIVDDIVKQSPRTCGRGSAAASVVAYSLGITNVDPIRYNLMFERFLNPGRSDPPDIDVDFAWDERDAVLDYVFATYGREHTAMVATHQTCGARMALREVARVYGLTESEISTVTKKIPWFVELPDAGSDLETLLHLWPGLRGTPLDHPWPDIIRDARSIIGLPRGIGTHCGGVVMTPVPIRSVAPIQRSAKGYPIVQWEKDGTEAMGMVKIDLLGNRSLAVIRDAVRSIRQQGLPFDEKNWDPQNDPKTRAQLAEGKTIGVFYVESPAMRLLQKKSGKGDFEHLVIHSSIIRPAANRFIRLYLERLHGAPYTPLHPLLADILAETYGIMVYQEDVAKVAIALAAFSVEEADRLRKIMAKKSAGKTLNDYRSRFFTGAHGRGVSQEVIAKVWEMMESFHGYSFCKPHSASYVQVSFQSAWLKAHYPAHFMAAVLSNYGGFYTTQAYISEAMRHGLAIQPPDVNKSDIVYTASRKTVVVGLCQIKGLTHQARIAVVSQRREGGVYRSLDDLLSRTGIEAADAERLLLAGAADSLASDRNRPRLFWNMRSWYRTNRENTAPELVSLTERQIAHYQYRTLGFLTGTHPIVCFVQQQKRPKTRAVFIERLIGRQVSICGWCVTSKTVSTSRGDTMEFVTFEDESGIFETVIFPDVYRRFASMLSWQAAFLLKGRVTEEFGAAVLEVASIERVSKFL